MEVSESVRIVQRLFEAFDAVDMEAMSKLLAPDFVAHGLPDAFSGDAEGWKALAAHWASGFAGDSFTFDDVITDQDKVVVRFRSCGRHIGEFLGVAPTNREVTITGIEIYHLAGGRVQEYWGHIDTSDLGKGDDMRVGDTGE